MHHIIMSEVNEFINGTTNEKKINGEDRSCKDL